MFLFKFFVHEMFNVEIMLPFIFTFMFLFRGFVLHLTIELNSRRYKLLQNREIQWIVDLLLAMNKIISCLSQCMATK